MPSGPFHICDFGPHRATFEIGGIEFRVQASSAASALMMAHLTANRLRYPSSDGTTGLGQHVVEVQKS